MKNVAEVDECAPEGVEVGDLWRNEAGRTLLIVKLARDEPIDNNYDHKDNRCFATFLWLDNNKFGRDLAMKFLWPIFKFTKISSATEENP